MLVELLAQHLRQLLADVPLLLLLRRLDILLGQLGELRLKLIRLGPGRRPSEIAGLVCCRPVVGRREAPGGRSLRGGGCRSDQDSRHREPRHHAYWVHTCFLLFGTQGTVIRDRGQPAAPGRRAAGARPPARPPRGRGRALRRWRDPAAAPRHVGVRRPAPGPARPCRRAAPRRANAARRPAAPAAGARLRGSLRRKPSGRPGRGPRPCRDCSRRAPVSRGAAGGRAKARATPRPRRARPPPGTPPATTGGAAVARGLAPGGPALGPAPAGAAGRAAARAPGTAPATPPLPGPTGTAAPGPWRAACARSPPATPAPQG